MNAAEPFVSLEDINKSHGGKSILKGFSLEIRKGDFIGVKGASGSGKSTLLNIIGLVDKADSGALRFFREDISGLAERRLAEIRAERIGFIFQSYNLVAKLTVRDNILLPLLFGKTRMGKLITDRMEFLCDWVGVTSLLDQPVDTLSGGEKQRAALVRALIKNPELILADEPTGNLDSVNSGFLLDILSRLNSKGRTVIIVTHDDESFNRCSRRVVIDGGRCEEL